MRLPFFQPFRRGSIAVGSAICIGTDMKNILFVASEAVPFIKTGGLADVVGSLPKYFDRNEYDVRVVLPKYLSMPWHFTERQIGRAHV